MTAAFDLTGRVALVTGSSQGIGRAIAEALAGAGAAVTCHGVEREIVDAVAGDWRGRGWRVATSTADLLAPDGVTRLASDIASLDAVPDILVINASLEITQTWDALTEDAMQRQCAVNLHATIRLIQAMLPPMRTRQWGRVLAIGSVQEEKPNPHHIFYAATKAAQTSLILNLARHERAPGVTFNVLKPGAILTDRNRGRLADPAYRDAVLARIPLGRIGDPQDCAHAALLLCSDAGGYINGAELFVDAGLRL